MANETNEQANQPINQPPPVPPPPPPAENKESEIDDIKTSIQQDQPATTPPPPTGELSPIVAQIKQIIKNPKIIIGAVAVIIIIIAGYFGYNYFIYNQGQLELTISDLPNSLRLNGESITPETSVSIGLKPGTYTIEATKDNYFPSQTSFTIEPQQTSTINLTFEPYPSPTNLIEFTSQFPHLQPQADELFYLSNLSTTFYKVNLASRIKDVISPNTFNEIQDITWSPAGTACIIKANNLPTTTDFQKENMLFVEDRPDNNTIFHLYDFSKYDLTSQTLFTYPKKIINPSWHPFKEEIIYHYIDPTTGDNSLSKSKPNLDNRELVIDLQGFNRAISHYSPDAEYIAVLDTGPDIQAPNPIYLFHAISREFTKIPTKDAFVDFTWSPDSLYLLGVKDDLTNVLIDINSLASQDLAFTASASHTAWLNQTPQIIISLSTDGSDDHLVLFDTTSGQSKDLVYTTDETFNTFSSLIISPDDTTLYFITNDNQHLYSLPIATLNSTEAEIIPE